MILVGLEGAVKAVWKFDSISCWSGLRFDEEPGRKESRRVTGEKCTTISLSIITVIYVKIKITTESLQLGFHSILLFILKVVDHLQRSESASDTSARKKQRA